MTHQGRPAMSGALAMITTALSACGGPAPSSPDAAASSSDRPESEASTSTTGDASSTLEASASTVPGSSPADAGSAPGEAGGADGDASAIAPKGTRFPAPGGRGVCPDAPLRITFDAPPTIGASGRIQVFKSSQPGAPVDTIDIAAPAFSDTIGGRAFQQTRPIFIDGSDAIIYLHRNKLVPNETYYVTVDAGVFIDGGRNRVAAVGPMEWSFTTGKASESTGNLVVAREGGGHFCTVQGAVDSALQNGPTVITIKNGTYHEIVYITGKSNLTLRGQDRKETIISYANNDALQNKLGTAYRAMVEVENTSGLVIENLTLHNTTPQNGSQAEALRVEPGDRVILRNADFISTQDTLLLSGRVYVTESYVAGNVDFIWGKGTAYFDRCEIKTVGRAGFNVQARNPEGQYGYVFVDSKLTSEPGITGQMLARIDVTPGTGYPASHVAYVDCKMDKHIGPKGWLITPAGTTNTGSLRFWEYRSTDLAGTLLDVSMRDPASKQLSAAEAMTMRDEATVLGGWNP